MKLLRSRETQQKILQTTYQSFIWFNEELSCFIEVYHCLLYGERNSMKKTVGVKSSFQNDNNIYIKVQLY